MASPQSPSPATEESGIESPRDSNSSPCRSERQTMRLFDPKTSPNHRAVPEDLLLAYNRERKVVHLRSCGSPATGIHADPKTLVISIDAVAYEGGKAGAALCFHPDSLWNVATMSDNTTKDEAQLEMLCFALNLIYLSKIEGPPLEAVYIRCTGTDFCLANAANGLEQTEPDRLAVNELGQEADKTLLPTLTDALYDVSGIVDVFLWRVRADEIKPVTEMATAYLYKQHGRDWYKEKGVSRGRFDVDIARYLDTRSSGNETDFEDIIRAKLEGYSIVVPQSRTSQGPELAMLWEAEARASLYRCLASSIVASNHCCLLAVDVRRANREGREICIDDVLHSYELAMELTSAREMIQRLVRDFIDQQRALRSQPSHGLEDGDGGLALFSKMAQELADCIAKRVSDETEEARLRTAGHRSSNGHG